jgi:hypothetical protein
VLLVVMRLAARGVVKFNALDGGCERVGGLVAAGRVVGLDAGIRRALAGIAVEELFEFERSGHARIDNLKKIRRSVLRSCPVVQACVSEDCLLKSAPSSYTLQDRQIQGLYLQPGRARCAARMTPGPPLRVASSASVQVCQLWRALRPGANGRAELANREFGREWSVNCRAAEFSATTYLQMTSRGRAIWQFGRTVVRVCRLPAGAGEIRTPETDVLQLCHRWLVT